MNIIQQGTEAKFKINIKDFDMVENNFSLHLFYGYRGGSVYIPKEMMKTDDDGNFYFSFSTDNMIGKIEAECKWEIPDLDVPDFYREQIDRQFLCFVAESPCPKLICVPKCIVIGNVEYTMIGESDITTRYYRLCDFYGNPLVTKNDEYILVYKDTLLYTKLIEGNGLELIDANGEVLEVII